LSVTTEKPQAEPGQLVRLRVEGMDCGSCVAKVETAARRLPGVSDVSADLIGETLTARLAPGANQTALAAAVAVLGYTVRPLAQAEADSGHGHARHHDEDQPEVPLWKAGKARLAAALAVLVAAAWVLTWAFPAESYWFHVAATLIAIVPFGRRALALARSGSPFSIETLMTVAALGATAIGAAEEAVVVVLLFAVGELLEGLAAARARTGIRALADLMPRTARLERDGVACDVPAASLAPGDVVQIRPGDRVPGDGTVLEGESALDESPVTGESVLVARSPGQAVAAGSVNTAALLRVRVTAAAEDNTISRIVRLVEQAAASRAPSQRLIERFSVWWTPSAMAVATVVALTPPLLLGQDWATWIYRGLATLLIACPCALVISVPAAIASALAAGARRGLLVKSGAALETVGRAHTIAFDKTGTLTEGRPRVTDVVAAEGTDERELLAMAASVEQGSAHPLALAIVREAEARGVAIPAARAGAVVPGKAAVATVGGLRLAVGSPAHATAQRTVLGALAPVIETLEAEGKTVVVAFARGRALGLLALRDEPRPDAASAVAFLRRMGIEAVMLTGDNERAARAVADALGLEARAGLLPADKLAEIERLRALGPVAMIGDGINDAPALAAADVGIAVGAGTAVALEAADAALLREGISGIAELVALSRAALANIRQSVAIAVGLKLLLLATTLVGATGLWMAILADTGATVLVTLNALRLLRWCAPSLAQAARPDSR
jgi:Cd2+/Zn2+-exporting ATPase